MAGQGRKFGRSKRGGSMSQYNAVRRDLRNKAQKVAKHTAAVKDKQENPPKVARGTARAKRRADMSVVKAVRTLKQRQEKQA